MHENIWLCATEFFLILWVICLSLRQRKMRKDFAELVAATLVLTNSLIELRDKQR